jgi:hypothetical protein
MGITGINGNVIVRVERDDSDLTCEGEILVTADGRRWVRCWGIPHWTSWRTDQRFGYIRDGKIDEPIT